MFHSQSRFGRCKTLRRWTGTTTAPTPKNWAVDCPRLRSWLLPTSLWLGIPGYRSSILKAMLRRADAMASNQIMKTHGPISVLGSTKSSFLSGDCRKDKMTSMFSGVCVAWAPCLGCMPNVTRCWLSCTHSAAGKPKEKTGMFAVGSGTAFSMCIRAKIGGVFMYAQIAQEIWFGLGARVVRHVYESGDWPTYLNATLKLLDVWYTLKLNQSSVTPDMIVITTRHSCQYFMIR